MAVIPSIYLVRYFYSKDSHKPEPVGLIIKVFFIGILSVIPVIIIEIILTAFFSNMSSFPLTFYFIEAFIVAGCCEEYIKLMVVKKYVYNDEHFDEVMDGIVYTVVASLGFACMENIIYVMSGDTSTAIMRAFTAVPLHAFASGIMGYYIGKAKFAETPEEEEALTYKGLFIAIGIHGLYNFILFVSTDYGDGYFGFLIFPLLYFAFKTIKSHIKDAIDDDIAMGR